MGWCQRLPCCSCRKPSHRTSRYTSGKQKFGKIGPDSRGGAGPPVLDAPNVSQNFDPFGLLPEGEGFNVEDLEIYDIANDNIVDMQNINNAVNQTDGEIALSSVTDHNDDMSNVQQVIRSPGARYEDGHIIIENSSLFYYWVFNINALEIKDNNDISPAQVSNQKWICTGLFYVPLDWLPFYMTEAQFNNLPAESEVVEVTAKITIWGSSVLSS